ncbi:peptidase [Achlya hypogyna]|uniref:Peptidase n=1 Tax=Achlya hypogyna TaxID=1202772 RepID=A0A1V9Y5W0_ACHHY|nr:peptidase [Achlya hypogyna]
MARVALHVYDLSRGLARQMSASLLGMHIEGVWHTGVSVYGLEYFYGGGIQAVPPDQVAETYGAPYEVVELGTTDVPQSVFLHFLQEIQPRFTAETYNLLSNNCNNFSNEVANFLVGTNIPQHILDLPQKVLSTPMGAMFRPMFEDMQGRMAASIQSHHNPSPLPTNVPTAKSLTDYSRVYISCLPDLHLERIMGRLNALQEDQLSAIQRLQSFATSKDPSVLQPSDRSVWWSIVARTLKESSAQATFTALCLLRLVLLTDIRAPVDHDTAAVVPVVDLILAHTQGSPAAAHRVLLLSVVLNGLEAPATKEAFGRHLPAWLTFVWATWSSQPTESSHAEMAACIVLNVCREATPADANYDSVQFALVGGCAEVLDAYANQAGLPRSSVAVERLVAGLGLLLQKDAGARGLADAVGLVQVLTRLRPKVGFGAMVSEVLALI